jgi:3-keto-5-aminohexanoate cleavage enzyme
MNKVTPLPDIMIAPNGARRGKQDHAALPIAINETIETTRACIKEGATGLHLHIRDNEGKHTLDSGIYLEALSEFKSALPDFPVQITTEAVGQYSSIEQRKIVQDIAPKSVSISIAEMLADGEMKEAQKFYDWCRETQTSVQHIVYDAQDLERIETMFPGADDNQLQLLFVLGRYTKNQQSSPDDLNLFYDWLIDKKPRADWAICAFGQGETDCLAKANKHGGKVRVGFENSIWNKDGSLAKDNAERVAEVVRAIGKNS